MGKTIKRPMGTGEMRYLARVFRPRGRDGKRKSIAKTFRTKKAAEAWQRETTTRIEQGTYQAPSKLTLGELLTAWLNGPATQRVRPQTLDSYRRVANAYVVKPIAGIPQLGDRSLRSLTLSDIDQLYASLRAPVERKDASGAIRMVPRLSPRTVRYLHSVLRASLRYAVRTGQLAQNPSDFATLPRSERAEPRWLDATQAQRFLEAAASDWWAALWTVLLMGGLRPSEALALRWADVECSTKDAVVELHVQRARVKGRGGYRFDECKTDRSRRTVKLPREAGAVLRTHRARQAEEKLLLGDEYDDQGLVFASERGTPPDYRCISRLHFKDILRRAKLPAMRLYDLRHSTASLHLAAGTPLKVVADMLGHSTITLTADTYSHVAPSQQEQAAETMGTLLTLAVAK